MNELEAKIVALEAVVQITILPLWRSILEKEVRDFQISTLEEMARSGDDFYTNRQFAKLIAEELRRWASILAVASQDPVTTISEPVDG